MSFVKSGEHHETLHTPSSDSHSHFVYLRGGKCSSINRTNGDLNFTEGHFKRYERNCFNATYVVVDLLK